MKYCIYCNAQNPDDAGFCSVCGKSFTPGGTDVQLSPAPQYGAPPVPPAVPMPPSPYDMPPVLPKQGDPAKNWMGITGMVLGILSILLCCLWYLSLIFGLGGLIFGILGMKSQQRGMSVAGIVTGAIGLLLGLFILIFYVAISNSPSYNHWYNEFYDDFFKSYSDYFDDLSVKSIFRR